MPNLQIIIATSGLTTTDKILEIIETYPDGISVTEISKEINRPVSMILICLKKLIAHKLVQVKFSQNRTQRIYYKLSHN